MAYTSNLQYVISYQYVFFWPVFQIHKNIIAVTSVNYILYLK